MVKRLRKLFSIRKTLVVLLILSIGFAAYSIHYKIKYWGFEATPSRLTKVWTVEAQISFEAIGEPIKISMAIPSANDDLKVLSENVTAAGYKETITRNGSSRLVLTSKPKTGIQTVYYKAMLYDNETGKGKTKAPTPKSPQKPTFDEQKALIAKEVLRLSEKFEGDDAQKIINVLNENPISPSVLEFLPVKNNKKDLVDAAKSLLALKNIPSRIIRGIKLEEDKKSFSPDLMLEAYIHGAWRVYDINTAQKGVPSNFVIFQRGGDSLLDIEGGVDSSVRFSVIKSINSSLKMTAARAEAAGEQERFKYSIYNLPIFEQNTLKWLMTFPLAILVVVVLRNVVGLSTMGTFTPMLLAMSLVSTGLIAGLACFALIVGLGLILRTLLSKFNLLLVPRISAVVIFVIMIMQLLILVGHQFELDIAVSAAYFPIIIMAWIIERASITWEEDGPVNAGREVLFSLIVAVFTYFIIASEYIRHIMFVFNELNLVILFIVMLLGTYTGYRLTELKRFAPLAKKGK